MRDLRLNLWMLGCLSLAATLVFAQATGKSPGGRKAASELPASADVRNGKEVYDTSCAVCHFRTSEVKKIGPGLRGLYKRGAYVNGKPVSEASLKEWIEKGGKDMPGFKDSLTAEQVRDLLAFLKTI